MGRFISMICLSLGLLFSLPAWSNALDDARQSGWVGERTDGFIGLVRSDAPDSVRALVASINQKRRAKYREVSNRNGQDMQTVGAIFSAKIISRLAPGWYYQAADGSWATK